MTQSKNSSKPTVIITGANGFLGSELVIYYESLQWNVIGLVRRPHSTTSPYTRYLSYDLSKEFDESIFKDADYLIHTAYMKYDKKNPQAMQVNINAANRLLAASRKHKLRKNIFISSMSSHEEAISVYGQQKLAIEELFSEKNDVSIRSGLILGKGGLYKQMADHIKKRGIVPLVDGGRQPIQIIGVHDLVLIITLLLVKDISGVITVAHPKTLTNKQFYEMIANKMHVKIRFIPVPFWLLRLVLKIADTVNVPLGVNEENLLGLKALRAVDTNKDLHKIGIALKSPEEVIKGIA